MHFMRSCARLRATEISRARMLLPYIIRVISRTLRAARLVRRRKRQLVPAIGNVSSFAIKKKKKKKKKRERKEDRLEEASSIASFSARPLRRAHRNADTSGTQFPPLNPPCPRYVPSPRCRYTVANNNISISRSFVFEDRRAYTPFQLTYDLCRMRTRSDTFQTLGP